MVRGLMTTLNGTYIVYDRWQPNFCATAEEAYGTVYFINETDDNWVGEVECPEGITREAFDKAADAWEAEYERKIAAEHASAEYQTRYPKATHRLMVRSVDGYWSSVDEFYPKHDQAHRDAAVKLWIDAIGHERVKLEDIALKTAQDAIRGPSVPWTTHL